MLDYNLFFYIIGEIFLTILKYSQSNVFINFDVLGEIIYLVALLMQGLNAQAALA